MRLNVINSTILHNISHVVLKTFDTLRGDLFDKYLYIPMIIMIV